VLRRRARSCFDSQDVVDSINACPGWKASLVTMRFVPTVVLSAFLLWGQEGLCYEDMVISSD
jgi:hypothetical protein